MFLCIASDANIDGCILHKPYILKFSATDLLATQVINTSGITDTEKHTGYKKSFPDENKQYHLYLEETLSV